MVKTIENPASISGIWIGKAATHLNAGMRKIGSTRNGVPVPRPSVRELTMEDLRSALRAGVDDFAHFRGDVIFLVLLYPVMGLMLAGFTLHLPLLPLLFPIVSGFAILGPLAAVGLYELSRRRERGEAAHWGHAFSVFGSTAFPALVVLGLYLIALFIGWMLAAYGIYVVTLGPEPPSSIGAFLSEVLTTGAGWAMIIAGIAVGACFAAVALACSVISFPLLLHRDTGVPVALITSIEVTRRNPRVVFTWGAIVAAALVVGSIPLLLGLVIVLPILGHATWHLYRRALEPEDETTRRARE